MARCLNVNETVTQWLRDRDRGMPSMLVLLVFFPNFFIRFGFGHYHDPNTTKKEWRKKGQRHKTQLLRFFWRTGVVSIWIANNVPSIPGRVHSIWWRGPCESVIWKYKNEKKRKRNTLHLCILPSQLYGYKENQVHALKELNLIFDYRLSRCWEWYFNTQSKYFWSKTICHYKYTWYMLCMLRLVIFYLWYYNPH